MTSPSAVPKVVVIGSINMDLVANCENLPLAGQTLTAHGFAEIPGGKGANQAVAAKRAGGDVCMVGRVGGDGFAERLRRNLLQEGVDCAAVENDANVPSGVALITVADTGDNMIVVVPGANGNVSPTDVQHQEALIAQCDVLLLQLEIPLETVAAAIEIAKSSQARVILDPAPTPSATPPWLFDVDLLCPNQSEAEALTGLTLDEPAHWQLACRQLHESGCAAVAITLGERGTALFDGQRYELIPSYPVHAVDTTAAGDAFAGAVAVRWVQTGSLREAILWGNAAGAIAASQSGAQPSMAHAHNIEALAGHPHSSHSSSQPIES